MLTQSGIIRAFTVDNRTKAKVGEKMQARLPQLRTSLGGKETRSGLQSCLTFRTLQGIELVNPRLNDAVREEMVKKANDKWLRDGGFTPVRRERATMLPTIPKR